MLRAALTKGIYCVVDTATIYAKGDLKPAYVSNYCQPMYVAIYIWAKGIILFNAALA